MFILWLLAHLSRRLTRWAYSIPMVHHLSFVVCHHPHFQTWISLKPVGQSWSNFMCSITGVGERLHKVLGQIGSKLWFPWQQKTPILTYNGENDVSSFSWLLLIWSFLCPPPKERGTYCFWCRSCWYRRQRDTFLFAQYLMDRWMDFN